MGNFIDAITGSDQADAAESAAREQSDATYAGIREQRAARNQLRRDLSPYSRFGSNQLTDLDSLINDPNAQRDFIQNNPFFNALAGDAQNRLMNVQAASGKLGTGDTPAFLQNQLLLMGNDLLQQSIGNRFNAVGVGQNSAAQSGMGAMNAANSISDLYGSGAAARGAGMVGAANARGAGMNNLLGIGAGAGLGAMGLLGSGVGAGGGALTGLLLSDRRFKSDIEVVGRLDCGIPVCRWRYVWSDQYVISPIAQDVQKVIPGAVVDVFGALYVDFDELHRVLH